MNIARHLFGKSAAVAFAVPGDERSGPDRKLRTFDIEMIAPYDSRAVVAFLRADKLSDLTSPQIRIFLLLRDTVAVEGLTASQIAKDLEMSRRSVRSCLSALRRLGYARYSSIERRDERGRRIVAWVHDGSHWASDDDALYWEFGEL